jgi:hypothetical protein
MGSPYQGSALQVAQYIKSLRITELKTVNTLLFVYDESFHSVKVFWEPASWLEGKDCPMTCRNIIC